MENDDPLQLRRAEQAAGILIRRYEV